MDGAQGKRIVEEHSHVHSVSGWLKIVYGNDNKSNPETQFSLARLSLLSLHFMCFVCSKNTYARNSYSVLFVRNNAIVTMKANKRTQTHTARGRKIKKK